MIDDQLRETPERSDGWIANDLGVHPDTVRARRFEVLGVRGEFSSSDFRKLPEKVIGRDGREFVYRPRKRLEEQGATLAR